MQQEQERVSVTGYPDAEVPDIGALFEYGRCEIRNSPRRYRVTGWYRPRPWRADAIEMAMAGALPGEYGGPWTLVVAELCADLAAEEGGKKPPLENCLRPFATHVGGAGIAGCLAPIARIRVIGMVDWPDERLQDARSAATRRALQIAGEAAGGFEPDAEEPAGASGADSSRPRERG